MYLDDKEALAVIKALTTNVSYAGQYQKILGSNPEFFPYYDPAKKDYIVGQVVFKEKEAPYNTEKPKYMLMKAYDPENIPLLSDGEYWQPLQSLRNINYWVKDELVLKDLQRISLQDFATYKSTQYIAKASIDPALTIDGKWVKVETEV